MSIPLATVATEATEAEIGYSFKNVPQRLIGEADERIALASRSLRYHIGFLDDLIRAILPHDLVLLGAASGSGKSQLAMSIAAANAANGKRVHFFALEAEPREIERRLRYRHLVDLALERRIHIGPMAYVDWYLGNVPDEVRVLEPEVDDLMHRRYRTLKTYYRADGFDHHDIQRLFMGLREETDLIVLDHLHYVDIEDENENRGFKTTLKMIRDVSLRVGRPVILVAHLRKKDRGSRDIVPDLDSFHGSSDIVKISTQAIVAAPAWNYASPDPSISHTFFSVPKDRRGGATGAVALCQFDRRSGAYLPDYQLGKASVGGDEWKPMDDKIPAWAKHHRCLPIVEREEEPRRSRR